MYTVYVRAPRACVHADVPPCVALSTQPFQPGHLTQVGLCTSGPHSPRVRGLGSILYILYTCIYVRRARARARPSRTRSGRGHVHVHAARVRGGTHRDRSMALGEIVLWF
eukprot:COSAG02_NODE_2276_length_9242_cov_933.673411_4_plen_110_part_00